MHRIKTQNQTKSYRAINKRYKTYGEVFGRVLPPLTNKKMRHAHILKSMRDVARLGNLS